MTIPASLQPLLSWSYWFTTTAVPFTGRLLQVVMGVAVASFAFGLVWRLGAGRFKDPISRTVVRRLANWFMTMGVLVGITLFFTQTETPTLGSRLWFLVWIVLGLVWLGFIVRYMVRIAPRQRQERTKQAELAKYLPRSN